MKGLGTDDERLINALTNHTDTEMEAICYAYQAMYGKPMTSAVAADCSGNYKNALVAMLKPKAVVDAETLRKAMKGLGTDEFALIRTLLTLDWYEMEEVKSTYMNLYNRNLAADVDSELSGDFKYTMNLILSTKPEAHAKMARRAMKGFGTDESALIRLLNIVTCQELFDMKVAYQALFSRDFIADLKSELSGPLEQALVALAQADVAQIPFTDVSYTSNQAATDAQVLRKAMKGVGTDESAIIRILTQRTEYQRQCIAEAYLAAHHKSLESAFRSETSGRLEECLVAMVTPRFKMLTMSLRKAMAGWGTDESALVMCLVHRPAEDLFYMRREYASIYQQDLVKVIRKECSGSFEDLLVCLVLSSAEVCALALDKAMKGLGTDDSALIQLLTHRSYMMPDIREAYLRQYGRPLAEAVSSECSGWYKEVLLKLVNFDSDPSLQYGYFIPPHVPSYDQRDPFQFQNIVQQAYTVVSNHAAPVAQQALAMGVTHLHDVVLESPNMRSSRY
eukprot:GILJ01001917.1.p1 GENE.GILJ01001917.1~~GILJ01001917.1.p1  ORF type:complete len:569 (+),score=89.68 GILJ01001917.1:189-1709(+)